MKAILLLCATVSFISCAPLYGDDGGYKGYATYTGPKNYIQKSLNRAESYNDDSIDASAGSPEFSREPSKSAEDASEYDDRSLPKKYDVLEYTRANKHGYGGNKIIEDNPVAPYDRAVLYGQSSGGFKMADTYQNQHIDKEEYTDDSSIGKEHDYKDEHIPHAPQPYEYGYAIKDKYGNAQHKHELSEGHGSVKGSYGFVDEHGLYRTVQYVADKGGFRATIKTNEPGTQSRNPADVHIDSEEVK